MIIALDFDDTYTADPSLWDTFISECLSRSHRVLIVTCRHGTEESREVVLENLGLDVPVYYTGHAPKRWFMEQLGVKVDIWIDDRPEFVVHGVQMPSFCSR